MAQVLTEAARQGLVSAPAELASHHEGGREPAAALRAYALAAQAALRSFAPLQSTEMCEHALGLLSQLPESPDRLALEFGIQSARGVAKAQLHGVGSNAAREVFERVRELCDLMNRSRSCWPV